MGRGGGLVGGVLLGALVAGCGGAGSSGDTAQTIEIQVSQMAYETKELTLAKGKAVGSGQSGQCGT